MGINTLIWLSSNDVTRDYLEYNNTMSRDRFKDVLNKAILVANLDQIHPSLANKIRTIGETKTKIAHSAWKIVQTSTDESCGCPMTEAGVVTFGEARPMYSSTEAPGSIDETILDQQRAVDKFVGIYDQGMYDQGMGWAGSKVVNIVD